MLFRSAETGAESEISSDSVAGTNTAEVVHQFVEHAAEPHVAPVATQATLQASTITTVSEAAVPQIADDRPAIAIAPVEAPTVNCAAAETYAEAPSVVTTVADAHTAAATATVEVSVPQVAAPVTEQAAAPAPATAAWETQATAHAATAAPANHATQWVSLEQALSSAGLIMAVTDPDKLRRVQEAAAALVTAPRVPRERKPAPPISNEPLVQVETRA